MYLQRYSAGIVTKTLNLLQDVEAKILARLARSDLTRLNRVRQTKLLDDIRDIMIAGYAPVIGALKVSAKELAVVESQFQINVLHRAIPVNVKLVTPAPKQLLSAVNSRPFQGRFLRDWYQNTPQAAFGRVRDAVRTGFAEGQTTEQIVRTIRGTRAAKYTDGILQQNRRTAQATVRTALNHTSNAARAATYQDNSDIIKGVQYVATLDGRTTTICASRDGNVYPVDSGPRPPAHVGCRSSTTPVVKSWKELGISLKEAPEGTRASLDGQVPASQNYSDFLRKQPANFQDEFLGKQKGILFRKGKLPLSKFVDRSGNDLTLDQLRLKEPDAWKSAGL